MPKFFEDPDEELEFIAAIEQEVDRLEVSGVLDEESARRAREHYLARRESITQWVRRSGAATASGEDSPGEVDYSLPEGELR